MYVFRPQQATGHAPGCSTTGARKPQHHVGRQAAKNQRRTQPKLRRPQTQQRRRQNLLRHLAGEGHVGLRCLAAEPNGNGHAGHSFLDVPVRRDGHRKGTARARLVDRLVWRISEELVAVLERKYGEKWPKHVMQRDFHIVEGMRRMCEAFCLRPELEWQVLKAVVNRARAIHSSEAEAGSEFPLEKQLEAQRLRTQSEEEEIASTSDGASVDDPLDGGSSEATTASESEQGQSGACDFCESTPDVVETSSGGSSSECDAESQTPWKASWQSRVLKSLGIQSLWPGRHAAAQATSSPTQQQQAQEPCPEPANVIEARTKDDEEDGDDEEHILSSKLVAAVRNAELNAAAQAGKGTQRHLANLDGPSSGAVAVTTANACTDDRAAKHRAVSGRIRFARQSEVIFFTVPVGAAASAEEDALGPFEYRRPLETKVFDGPSGHKARRTHSSEAKASAHGCEDESRTRLDSTVSETSLDGEDQVAEDVEDWEDRCDDIAELMAQQRSCLLWSPLW